MKTEIEFRVWSHELQKMLYQISPVHSNEDTGQVVFSFGKINFGAFDFLQYIGIKDKNDKKIFKGDIMRYHYGYDGMEYLYYEVKYGISEERRVGFYMKDYLTCSSDEDFLKGEVISNIYENPELITNGI